MSRQLGWHETAPGLLDDARGDSNRRYLIAADGHAWALDLVISCEYEAE